MSKIHRFAVPLQWERHDENADNWNGETYEAPETIQGVYDPSYTDLSPDNPERRTGTVLTEAEISLRDKIEGQVVTQVTPRYPRGEPVYYEVKL